MPKVSVEYEQQQRSRIIEGAARTFADKGFRQTTIDSVAQALGVSKGSIYSYFESKEALFIAVYAELVGRRFNMVCSSFERGDTVIVKLQKLLDNFTEALLTYDKVFARVWLDFQLERPNIPAANEMSRTIDDQFHSLLYSLLKAGQTSGEFKADLDIASITTVILATCDGLLLQVLGGQQAPNGVEIRRALWNTYYNLLKV